MKKLLLAGLALAVPSLAFAQDAASHVCTYGDLTRRVEIVYETGVMVPCEVHYYKDDEAPGSMQVLWRALNEAGYCEARTREFVARLEGMGWSCSDAAAPAVPAAEPAMPEDDDTDALAPADDIEVPEQEPET